MSSTSAYKVGEHPAPFQGTREAVKGIASVLALMPQLLLYRGQGLNIVSKPRIIGLTLFLLGASWLGNLMFSFSLFGGFRFGEGNDVSLLLFALFVLLPLGLWENSKRLREERRGAKHIHTWWPGDPRLDFLPVSENLLRMAVNPAVCFIGGAFLRYELGARLLGFWLMVSGFALLLVEWTIWRQSLEHGREVLDRTEEAGWEAQILRPRTEGTAAEGIATASDAGLEAEIERRRGSAGKGETIQ